MCPWMELNHTGSYTFKGSIPALAALEQGRAKYIEAQKARQTKALNQPIGPLKFNPDAIKVGNAVTGKQPGMKKKKKIRSATGNRP